MPVFRKRISQSMLTWILTALACAALLPALLIPITAQAELRAFRLKITNADAGTERLVLTRFDHVQYPMYNFVARNEKIEIDQTWMCYQRSDYLGALCPAPEKNPAKSPADASGGPGLAGREAGPTNRTPASAPSSR